MSLLFELDGEPRENDILLTFYRELLISGPHPNPPLTTALLKGLSGNNQSLSVYFINSARVSSVFAG